MECGMGEGVFPNMAEQPVGNICGCSSSRGCSRAGHLHCLLSHRFSSTASTWRGCCEARHCPPHSKAGSGTGWLPTLCPGGLSPLPCDPWQWPATGATGDPDHRRWDHLLPAAAARRARLEDAQPTTMWAVGSQQLMGTWLSSCLGGKCGDNAYLRRCFLRAQPMALLLDMLLQAG